MANIPYSKVLKGSACARAYGSGPDECFVALGLVPDSAHSVLKGTQWMGQGYGGCRPAAAAEEEEESPAAEEEEERV